MENHKNNMKKIYDNFEVIDKEKNSTNSFIDIPSYVINKLENMIKRKSNKEYFVELFLEEI